MKRIISFVLVLCMLLMCSVSLTANAAVVNIETVDEGERWNGVWSSQEQGRTLRLNVQNTGLYNVTVNDNKQTGFVCIMVADITAEELLGYIMPDQISPEYVSKEMMLVKDHVYELACSYVTLDDSGEDLVYLDADIYVRFDKNEQELTTVPTINVLHSGLSASFSQSDNTLWLKYTTTQAGDYTFNFTNLHAIVTVYNAGTGERVASEDTEFYTINGWTLRSGIVVTLEENTEYYINIGAYEVCSGKLSMTKNSKNVKSVAINEQICPFDSFMYIYDIDETCFDYLVTYTDNSTEVMDSFDLGKAGYTMPGVEPDFESISINGDYYLPAGEQTVSCDYNGQLSECTVYIESLTEFLSDTRPIKQDEKMKIVYAVDEEQTRFWRINVTENGYYGGWRKNSDDFNTNFDTYSMKIVDDKNNIVEFDYDKMAWPLKKNTEYVLVFNYQFDPNYTYNEIEFWLQKQEDLLEGWVKDGGKWYFYENGEPVKNTWKKDSTGWCYLDWDGAMATNKWVKDSIGWCYVGENGYAVTNCWKKDSVGWCYLNSEGSMVKNNWVKDGGKWYYLDGDGYMVSNGWRKDSKGWCYLGSDGAMVTNSWIRDSVGWCYVGSDGYCITNSWQKDSKGWCYLDSEGRMVTNAWVNDSHGRCWLDANGYWDGKYY